MLVRRFSAKEELRRVKAFLFTPDDTSGDWIAFENHLNVIHDQGRGVDPVLARGIALWLNSTCVDRYVRAFNGHTQVNATDLRRVPLPRYDELESLASFWPEQVTCFDQDAVDVAVAKSVPVLLDLGFA